MNKKNAIPNEVLACLKEGKSKRVKSSLDAIYKACEDQVKAGTLDFSYSNIALTGKPFGVPAAQSIRNKTGEVYRTLIAAFAKQNEAARRSTMRGHNCSWIDEIEDPVLRLQVKMLDAERRKAEELAREVVPVSQVIEVYDGVATSYANGKLNLQEREALEYLMSNEFLRRFNLAVGKSGSVVDSATGKTFFPVATFDALAKAIENL
ncbi:gamma-mobile-trio protein GmtX [Alteromonas naphthalenivorans]|uniref:Uncharacterized protein n=1 Tax=Alteromonas naphthalenivorans TaxID=715451 RepID=F5ZG41_ALTNA|nr:gamma-mobile-trio protein GmtX [Alteromonas naphthalenivorans]AEF05809.1 hypothetical protein ambt_21600 [Alteromonas naphthalenivorans]